MEFRLATQEDLPRLYATYAEIARHMDEGGVSVWDDVYPAMCFAGDIENRRLHLLAEDGEIAAAFALCDGSAGAEAVRWGRARARALYLERLGVNVRFLRRGLGGFMLERALALTEARGAQALRLFVAESNVPALRLYQKSGFRRAEGVYAEKITEDFTLRLYGFEKNV